LHTPAVRKREKAERKVYFVDNLLMTKYGGGFSQNFGRLMEAAVYRQLKQNAVSYPNRGIYYYQDNRNREVDFIVRQGEAVDKLIQVAYFEKEAEMAEREMAGLVKAMAVFGLNQGTVVNWGVDKKVTIGSREIELVSLGRYLSE